MKTKIIKLARTKLNARLNGEKSPRAIFYLAKLSSALAMMGLLY